ncbi:aquaporin-like protein [Teratosphaeria nubilosa]|uniref:Aquaporin-like protein n=1 Tax=Teratosphaeria nubilosa TaxID=161662 RepID=A0A6G1KUT6_9PEZI|nr:aquaporin-like protein [Teratosphaeria nubilosa]
MDEFEFEVKQKLVHRIPYAPRNHFVAMIGEFVGTFLFLFFSLSGTQIANNIPSSSDLTTKETGGANPQQLQYISLCFGFSLAVNAWVFFRISGGLFNPAVTLGMWLIGALPLLRAVLLFCTEIIAGIAAAAVVRVLFPGKLNCQTTLGGGTSTAQGVFIEMFLTAQLIVTIFMLAAEKHKGTFIAPVGIGLSLFIAELSGVYYTGGSLNPARSIGPEVAALSFKHYSWIYWVGPFAGAIIAAGFYKFIKFMEYETANPGQDSNEAEEIDAKRQKLLDAGADPVQAHAAAQQLVEKEKQETLSSMGAVNLSSQRSKASLGDDSGSSFDSGATAAPYPGTNGVPPMPAHAMTRGAKGSSYASPAVPTQEDLFSHTAQGGGPPERMGDKVEQFPGNRFARTISSGV